MPDKSGRRFRLKYSIIIWFIAVFIQLCQSVSVSVSAQTFNDALRLKLPRPDQYKFMKAKAFNSQGKAYLTKAKALSDSLHMQDKKYASTISRKDIDAYYAGRINASYCFRSANGLLFGVLEKHIRKFWHKHKNDKKKLQLVLNVENAALDSLEKGDKLRENAEGKLYMNDKIPLVAQAEKIENHALFRLQKVLFIYLNWPHLPNLAWLYSNDTFDPYNRRKENQGIQLASIPISKNSLAPDTLSRATSLYSRLHISEDQIDSFNEFLKKTHPGKMETYLINFQGLYNTVVDSLQREWLRYQASGIVPLDTLRPTLPAPIPQPVKIKKTFTQKKYTKALHRTPKNKFTSGTSPRHETGSSSLGFQYKVQIAASRLRIGNTELHGIYDGPLKINESFENNWYKYILGSFSTYMKARQFRDSLIRKVKGAFVIACFHGKRIRITTTLIDNRSHSR